MHQAVTSPHLSQLQMFAVHVSAILNNSLELPPNRGANGHDGLFTVHVDSSNFEDDTHFITSVQERAVTRAPVHTQMPVHGSKWDC